MKRLLLAVALLLVPVSASAEIVNVPDYVLKTGGTMTGSLTLSAGSLTLTLGSITMGGHLKMGLNQELRLDADGNSYIECTADNTCNAVANGNIALQWTSSGTSVSNNLTAGVVAINFTSASTFRIANGEAAAPTEPVACAAGTFGTMKAQNDTNDGAHSQVCYCGQLANDSTYDWLIVGTTTACPFF